MGQEPSFSKVNQWPQAVGTAEMRSSGTVSQHLQVQGPGPFQTCLSIPGPRPEAKPGGSVALCHLCHLEDYHTVLRIADDLLLADKLKLFSLCSVLRLCCSGPASEER